MSGGLDWYALSVLVVWACQIVYDGTAERPASLSPMIFYVAAALVWPIVALWVLALLARKHWRIRRQAVLAWIIGRARLASRWIAQQRSARSTTR